MSLVSKDEILKASLASLRNRPRQVHESAINQAAVEIARREMAADPCFEVA